MQTLHPATQEQLADALQSAAGAHRTIRLGGNFSKDRLGGRPCPSEIEISASAMNRVLQYDPRDLTISVEAGISWAELERTLAEHREMLPLDPGWRDESTAGGVVGANLSGPRRRLYGTVRDMIIGMTFATLEGKLIQSGGMVVKNVAGLDMGKLMIGSFGTLAAIAVINFKVFPMVETRTFAMEFATAAEAFAERDRILRSVLQPQALDIVNWPSGFRLLVRAGGN
ncbi:MAG TPA: FAD-binding oxidoreductase, partial [Bryobacteraceae bacterium]|nr:FAD-binding oxidoreductase [Bryobacteraceae bacterium]